MRSQFAFIKKEFLEQIRSGKALILGMVFLLFGIMNPAVAKLTPWLLGVFAESLEGTGITVGEASVSALDSWMQFYKNIPMGMIVFALVEGGIFTREYESGTLILSLTKGFSRPRVIIAKSLVLFVLWSLYYLACYFITYAYNAFFWDNSVAECLGFSVFCWWLFGVFVISLMVLFSTIATSIGGVLLGVGGVIFTLSIAGIVEKVNKCLPIKLTDGTSLLYGASKPDEYGIAILVTLAVIASSFAVSFLILGKKQL